MESRCCVINKNSNLKYLSPKYINYNSNHLFIMPVKPSYFQVNPAYMSLNLTSFEYQILLSNVYKVFLRLFTWISAGIGFVPIVITARNMDLSLEDTWGEPFSKLLSNFQVFDSTLDFPCNHSVHDQFRPRRTKFVRGLMRVIARSREGFSTNVTNLALLISGTWRSFWCQNWICVRV